MEIKFEFEWKKVESSKDVRYNYPEKISAYMRTEYGFPAVYRWVIRKGKDIKLYIGETDQLCPKRLNGYINPGPSQFTNIRMKKMLLEFKRRQYFITFEFLLIKRLSIDDKDIHSKNLNEKYVRKFIENLLLWHYLSEKSIEILNK